MVSNEPAISWNSAANSTTTISGIGSIVLAIRRAVFLTLSTAMISSQISARHLVRYHEPSHAMSHTFSSISFRFTRKLQ